MSDLGKAFSLRFAALWHERLALAADEAERDLISAIERARHVREALYGCAEVMREAIVDLERDEP